MKPYRKNRLNGYESYAEIFYNKEKDKFCFHVSSYLFNYQKTSAYLFLLSHQLLHPITYNKGRFDTAAPKDRKKINELHKKIKTYNR